MNRAVSTQTFRKFACDPPITVAWLQSIHLSRTLAIIKRLIVMTVLSKIDTWFNATSTFSFFTLFIFKIYSFTSFIVTFNIFQILIFTTFI